MKSLGEVRVELWRIEAKWEPRVEGAEAVDDDKLKMRRIPDARAISYQREFVKP